MKLSLFALAFACLLASAPAFGDATANCQFVVGNGTAEQPEGFTPWLGPVTMRIGDHLLEGTIDVLATEGFADFDFNEMDQDAQLVGFAKGTYDFGELGAFHFYEVDVLTFTDVVTFSTADLVGKEHAGPARDAEHTPFTPWGSGAFADTDADLRLRGWIEFGVTNPAGAVVNQLSFLVWGQLCNVQLD